MRSSISTLLLSTLLSPTHTTLSIVYGSDTPIITIYIDNYKVNVRVAIHHYAVVHQYYRPIIVAISMKL